MDERDAQGCAKPRSFAAFRRLTLEPEITMPFDNLALPPSPDLSVAGRVDIRAILTGWVPRPIGPRLAWWRPAGLLAGLALLRAPLSDRPSLLY